MTDVLKGVRVLEVATFGFVPAAGAALSDWGAEVVKVENASQPDPIRGLIIGGIPPGTGGVTFMWEVMNRGKRAIALDIASERGHEILMSLVETADVFLTNFLAQTLRKLSIDVPDVMARNPRIVYARGTGHGPAGPDAEKGGFDSISYWYRTGIAAAITPEDAPRPLQMPGPAFGDIQSGMMLAGGVGTAIGYRDRTGKGVVVDLSLLSAGMWAMQPGIVGTSLIGVDKLPVPPGHGNPLVQSYRTSDGRYVALNFVQPDRYWSEFCSLMGHPEWAEVERFSSLALRKENYDEVVGLLEEVFATRPLAEWEEILARGGGQWNVIRTASEARADPQVRLNGFVQDVEYDNGVTLPLVSAPVQFDAAPPTLRPAPSHGRDTREILEGLGVGAEEIDDLRAKGIVATTTAAATTATPGS